MNWHHDEYGCGWPAWTRAASAILLVVLGADAFHMSCTMGVFHMPKGAEKHQRASRAKPLSGKPFALSPIPLAVGAPSSCQSRASILNYKITSSTYSRQAGLKASVRGLSQASWLHGCTLGHHSLTSIPHHALLSIHTYGIEVSSHQTSTHTHSAPNAVPIRCPITRATLPSQP